MIACFQCTLASLLFLLQTGDSAQSQASESSRRLSPGLQVPALCSFLGILARATANHLGLIPRSFTADLTRLQRSCDPYTARVTSLRELGVKWTSTLVCDPRHEPGSLGRHRTGRNDRRFLIDRRWRVEDVCVRQAEAPRRKAEGGSTLGGDERRRTRFRRASMATPEEVTVLLREPSVVVPYCMW